MHVIGNKQFNLRHVATVTWNDDPISAPDPGTGLVSAWHSFDIQLSNGHVERMLFATEEERKERWEELISEMEEAGF